LFAQQAAPFAFDGSAPALRGGAPGGQPQRSPTAQSRTDIPVQRAPSAVPPPAETAANRNRSDNSRTDIPVQKQSRSDNSRTDIPVQKQSRSDNSRTDIPVQRPASAVPPPPPAEAAAPSSQSRTDLPAQRAPSAMPPAVPADARGASGGRARRESSANVRVSTTQLLATNNGAGTHEDPNAELAASLQAPLPAEPPPRDRWSRPGASTLSTMPVVPPPRTETQRPQRRDDDQDEPAQPAAEAKRADPTPTRATNRPRSKFEPHAPGNEAISSERPEHLDPASRRVAVRQPGRALAVVAAISVGLVLLALLYRWLAPDHAGVGDQPEPAPSEQPAAEPTQPEAPANAQPAAPTAEPTQPAQPEAQGTAAPAPTEPAAPAAPASEVDGVVAEAKALEQQGKPQAALKLYERAAQLDPNSSPVLSHLAFGYLNRGDNQQAADFAARAVAIDPTSSEGWIVLGAARDALGDGKAARDAYRKCVELGQGDYVQECRRVAH
jgi:cytochrome c-type biogenesis protein CcmH/NrfG